MPWKKGLNSASRRDAGDWSGALRDFVVNPCDPSREPRSRRADSMLADDSITRHLRD